MKRLFALLPMLRLNLKAVVFGIALTAGILSFPQATHAATAYYVSVTDVYVRRGPQSYAMGRLYNYTNTGQGRMDIQYISPGGWAWGYAYGYVNRCLWAQFTQSDGTRNFRTNGTTVSNKCGDHRELSTSEFTNGEIWSNSTGTDGVLHTIARDTPMWDNWSWSTGQGNPINRGVASAGSIWKIRYTTIDGNGVMARPCVTRSTGAIECLNDWLFIQRSSL